MKLFQQLLLAPAALGLLAPLAANAAEVNIKDVAGYANKSAKEVRAITKTVKFSDVVPGDWTYTALTNLSKTHGCVDSSYSQSLNRGQSLSRYEAAALINACLANGVASNQSGLDISRLSKEFGPELAVIRGQSGGSKPKPIASAYNAGQFSPNTKITGKTVFHTGYVVDDGDGSTDATTLTYVATANVYSSFTGRDQLYTRIKSGNMTGAFESTAWGTHLSDANSNANTVKVDKIWYQFPVYDDLLGGDVKAWVGPLIENYYMLASSASIYRPVTKQFANGGNGYTYGSSTSPGAGFAWIQNKDDRSDARWAFSSNYASYGGDNGAKGLFTNETDGKWLSKLEYGSPRWQVSLAGARHTCAQTTAGVTSCKQWASYYTTTKAEDLHGNTNSYALRGYWKPEETGIVPSVSLGYEVAEHHNQEHADGTNYADATPTESKSWMAGFMWQDAFIDDNLLGFAFGAPHRATKIQRNHKDLAEDAFTWELYYDHKLNDSISVKPAIFGANDRNDGTAGQNDWFGGLVSTTFKF